MSALADPQIWAFAGAGALSLALAVALARARAPLAVALLTIVLAALAGVMFLALDAPDAALAQIGAAGVIGAIFLAAFLLTGRSGAPESARPRSPGRGAPALAAVAACAAALLWATPDLPAFGEGGAAGRLYVNRAAGEVGARSAVWAVGGDYRAFDALAQALLLVTCGLGVHALLGLGERAALGRARRNKADAEAGP